MKVLSKTDFIHYLRCPDSLWLEKYKPDKFNKGITSSFLLKLIKEGYEVELDMENAKEYNATNFYKALQYIGVVVEGDTVESSHAMA